MCVICILLCQKWIKMCVCLSFGTRFVSSCQFTAGNTWWQSALLHRHTSVVQNTLSCQWRNVQVLLWINHTDIPDERGVTLGLIRLIIWSELGVVSPREHQMCCFYRAITNTIRITYWKHFMLDSTGVWRDGNQPRICENSSFKVIYLWFICCKIWWSSWIPSCYTNT